MIFSFLIFHILISAKRFLIFKYVIFFSVVKLDNSSALHVDFIDVEFDDNIAIFVSSNRLRLSFIILFKLSFESIFNYLSFSKLIIKKEIFFSYVTKAFFVSITVPIEFLFSRVINRVFMKFFSKFSAELTFCDNFFHFILDEVKNLFEIFWDHFYIMIAYLKVDISNHCCF